MAGLVGIFLFRTFYKEKMKSEENVLLTGWIVLGILLPLIYSIIKIPMLEPRYTIIILPAIITCIGIGLSYLTPLIASGAFDYYIFVRDGFDFFNQLILH